MVGWSEQQDSNLHQVIDVVQGDSDRQAHGAVADRVAPGSDSDIGLPDYLADNYGRCIAVTCQCRKDGCWLGRACLHWMPSKARSFGELQNEQIVFVREARR